MKLSAEKIIELLIYHSDSQTIISGQKLIRDKGIVSCHLNEESKEYTIIFKGNSKIPLYKSLVLPGDGGFKLQCSCNGHSGNFCPHLVASLYAVHQKYIAENGAKILQKRIKIISDFSLTTAFLNSFSSKSVEKKLDYLRQNAEILIKKGEGIFDFEISENNLVYRLLLKKRLNDKLTVSCTCGDNSAEMCVHALFGLEILLESKGKYAFEETYNWDEEKEYQLNKFGLSLTDDLTGKVEFEWENGKPKLKILDKNFTHAAILNKAEISATQLTELASNQTPKPGKQEPEESAYPFTIAYIINVLPEFVFNILAIDIISGKFDKMAGKFTEAIQNLSLKPQSQILSKIRNQDLVDFVAFRENFNRATISETIKEKFPLLHRRITSSHFVSWVISNNEIPDYIPFIAYYLPFVQQLTVKLQSQPVFKPIRSTIVSYERKNIRKIQLSDNFASAYFEYSENEGTITLKPVFMINNRKVQAGSLALLNFWLVGQKTSFSAFKDTSSVVVMLLTVSQNKPTLQFNHQSFPEFIEKFVQPYHFKIKGIKDDDLQIENLTLEPERKIRLAETGNFLLFYPSVKYGETEVLLNRERDTFTYIPGGGYLRIARDRQYEKAFKDFIVGLHKKFNPNTFLEYYSLHCDEAMRRTWFISFYQKCKENGIEVYGFNSLRQFRFNPSHPVTNYSIKSSIDWFDLRIEVSFGDQKADLLDVRKAVMKQENIVMLKDGSLGMLPDEWLKEWSDLLKFGHIDDGKLKVSNIHYTLIDKFSEQTKIAKPQDKMVEPAVFCKDFRQIDAVSVSPNLKAELRDYQLEGLKWLAFQAGNRWGGCLADDMGLGKTIQVLAFFCYLSEKDLAQKNKFLVISPTTLIFNWQAEINKFCPHFKTYVFHGSGRKMDNEILDEYDIFLTSYGTMVYDLQAMKDIRFNCIILDEAQAIKNVNSLRYKAVSQLQADYRFTLTGTPIENSTLELYAQMQFTNPGLLGNFSFFKNEYFEAIEKKQDNEKASDLISLIRPFMLRRTKEEVAKDLPEKTEMILLCEMEEEQRLVYDSFRIEMRKHLLGRIDELGMGKAKMNILESLLKLRQICDSPALLKTDEDFGNASAKADELLRHIKSKTGKHKILVFSQFLGMLNIIKERLDIEKINYSYLDGKTMDRQAAVEVFQNDAACRVFLLSLKAAGFGLNLTEADYVYLIDPWWNPAVEEQAMDRAHRIGQKNKVFAYRMICKDTIEEKIMELQKRKKELSDRIISSESSFVQDLSREDLEALLS
jgi:hypothetical protein